VPTNDQVAFSFSADKPQLKRGESHRKGNSSASRFHEALAQLVGISAGFLPLLARPHGVEVTSREAADTILYFLLHLTEDSHDDIPFAKNP
jgi:hypothetical protein